MARIAILGATGAVGREVITLLEKRQWASKPPMFSRVDFFASEQSAKKNLCISFFGQTVPIQDSAQVNFNEFDVAIFAMDSKEARVFAERARGTKCVVIDNSSAFRMDDTVPLVVPEINEHDIKKHQGLIANPNCTTAITLMALYPLHQAFGLTRVSATSCQAVSGAGSAGLAELEAQLVDYHGDTRTGDGQWRKKMHSHTFPQPIAMNVIPQVGSFLENGSTDEEMKFLNEGRKIMHHPTLKASMTCVRVPTKRVHCIDVLAEFDSPIDTTIAYAALRGIRGLDVMDGTGYPTPLTYSGQHNCGVGRLRVDQAYDNAFRFWVAGDQLLKGAALNAVQITDRLIKGQRVA